MTAEEQDLVRAIEVLARKLAEVSAAHQRCLDELAVQRQERRQGQPGTFLWAMQLMLTTDRPVRRSSWPESHELANDCFCADLDERDLTATDWEVEDWEVVPCSQ